MTESNTDIVFGEETFITITRDGELIGIERINGHVQRFTTKHATLTDSRKIYGLDRVKT